MFTFTVNQYFSLSFRSISVIEKAIFLTSIVKQLPNGRILRIKAEISYFFSPMFPRNKVFYF